MNTFESMGLGLAGVEAAPGSDKTEHIDQIKEAISVLVQQASALSADQLRDPVLDQRLAAPGCWGSRFRVLPKTSGGSRARRMLWRTEIWTAACSRQIRRLTTGCWRVRSNRSGKT